MNEQILKKVVSNIVNDAKSSLLEQGNIPVIWNMVKDADIYQISKTIASAEDSKLALELAGLAYAWIEPEYIIQVANTQMKVKDLSADNETESEMLLVIKHIKNRPSSSLLCRIYRDHLDNVTGFSHFYGEQEIQIDDPLFKPYEIVVNNPSNEAIKIIQGMFGKTSPLLRLVS